jgi:signal transduction histidine kinase
MTMSDFVAASEAFGDAMDLGLGDPLARARDGSRVLANQVSADHAPVVRSIVDALERSETALRDLLEFVRSGELRVTRRRADLKPMCERVIDSVERRYQSSRAVEFDSEPCVIGDWDTDAVAGLLSRLLAIMLDDETRGAVGVRLRSLKQTVIIDVWSACMLPAYVSPSRALEPLRVATNRTGGGGRLSVGLHLASLAARAHEGRIDATSDEIKGTTFRVTLPRYAPEEPVFTRSGSPSAAV